MDKRIGAYSFMAGIVIAIILGIFSKYIRGPVSTILISVLIVLGLLVGFLNVAGKETREFLLVATVLIVASSMGGASVTLNGVQYIGRYLVGIMNNIMAFVVPAVIVVGLKDIVRLAKTP